MKNNQISNASCNALTHDALTYMAVTVTHYKRGMGRYANGVGGEALVLRGSPFICGSPSQALTPRFWKSAADYATNQYDQVPSKQFEAW